jgi:nicotinamidase-related amidase
MASSQQHTDESTSDTALLFIDVINDLDFEGNEGLIKSIPELVENLNALRGVARELGIPLIYVNDNFKKWRSSFEQTMEHCSRDGAPGAELARNLAPQSNDYFVLKPMHSGFYCTPLELLLRRLKVIRLILTGVAGNICVLFTADDAYMRGFELIVPCDAVASNCREDNDYALSQMHRIHRADTRPVKDVITNLYSRNGKAFAH